MRAIFSAARAATSESTIAEQKRHWLEAVSMVWRQWGHSNSFGLSRSEVMLRLLAMACSFRSREIVSGECKQHTRRMGKRIRFFPGRAADGVLHAFCTGTRANPHGNL